MRRAGDSEEKDGGSSEESPTEEGD